MTIARTLAMLEAPRPGATLEAFRKSPAYVRGLMGPMNAARTTTCILEILDQARAPWPATTPAPRRSRCAIVRAALDSLLAKTIPAFHALVPPEEVEGWDVRSRRFTIGFDVKSRRVRELEVYFLAADQVADRKRLANLDLTWGWIHEARELGDRGVLAELVDATGNFPPLLELARHELDEPRAGVLLSSRPPANGHWWQQVFDVEQPEGYALFRQPPGRSAQAENLDNLPRGFYQRAANKPAEWVRCNVDGEYPEASGSAIERAQKRRLWSYYPDEGPLRRELYPKHMEFMRAGAVHRERLALAANRVGKTEGMGGYESTMHMTGHYPAWWEGKVFDRPVRWWAAGRTQETTRDIIQAKLFGPVAWDGARKVVEGTGLVPFEDIGDISWRRGSDLIDTVKIRHRTAGVVDGWSILGLKSYEQGSGSFEGTEQDGIWLDEEPDLKIYTECLIRTMTTDGLILLTFTPLEGMSEVVLQFLPGGKLPDRIAEAAAAAEQGAAA